MRDPAFLDDDRVNIDLHSTGTSPVRGTSLAPGAVDPYWAIVLGQAGFSPIQARILNTPPYVPTGEGSAAWVWIDADGTGAVPDSVYIFRNIIDLSNVNAEELPVNFTVSSFNADPFVVAVNGHRIDFATESSFRDLTARSYTIPAGLLKRILNTLDILVRVDTQGLGTSGLSVQYSPCTGIYSPTVVTTRSFDSTSSNASSNSNLFARIPSPPPPSPPYQDLSISLGTSVKPESSSITAQIVTLDECDDPIIPVGGSNVYNLSVDPSSTLTVRILGYSQGKNLVYLRVWAHPVQSYFSAQHATRNVAEAIALGRLGRSGSGVGDPISWPTNSGVVVVVTDTGGGPMRPKPAVGSI